MNITVNSIVDGALLPQKSDDGVTSLLFARLYNDDDGFVDVGPHSVLEITTGIELEIPEGYMALILPLGELSAQQGLDIASAVGVVTSATKGEIKVMLHNDGDYQRTVNDGQAIAKLLVLPAVSADFI